MTEEFKSLDTLYEKRVDEVGEDKVFPFETTSKRCEIYQILGRHKVRNNSYEYWIYDGEYTCIETGEEIIHKLYTPPKEPVYEYLWNIERPDKSVFLGSSYSKTKEKAIEQMGSVHNDFKVLERCDWSERKVEDD